MDLAYGDAIGPDGLPRLKPDWSPDLALATGYPGRPLLASRPFLAASLPTPLGPMTQMELALEIAAVSARARVAHVARPLARVVADPLDPPARAPALDARLKALGRG